MAGDSAADAVRERSGKSHARKAYCSTEGCPDDGKEKLVWAVKNANGLLQIARLFCPECRREVVLGPWND